MKLTQFNRKVMTNGGDSTKFTAEMNAAFFAVASDTMYQYKIAAIIRETACNAYDSHIEAGIEDEPFNVILPNDFNPNLTIEDFGVGLDDKGVRTVFASYFKSTKNDSEKQTGGFGIGAKSVFSYSATFEVVARKDGVERVYVCFIGEEGIPEVQIFSENPTDHRNGVRVKIPVQKQDFHRFNSEAEVIMSFFPTTPIVTGGLGVFEPMVTDLHEQIAENGFARIRNYTNSDLYSGHNVYALVNNVIYPIPSSVYRELDNADFIDVIRNTKSLVLKFEDGQLPPAAPRESLSLNERTKSFIQKALNDILETKRSEYQEKVDEFNHPHEALEYVREEFGFAGIRNFTYKGRKVGFYRNRPYTIPNTEYIYVTPTNKGPKRKLLRGRLDISSTSKYENFVIVYRENGVKETPIKTHISKYIKAHNISPNSTLFIVLDGCPANRPERVKALINVDATIIDNQTLKEDMKSTRIGSGITYNQGNRTDTTVFAKTITNNGELCRAENTDVSEGEYLHIPSDYVNEHKRYATPSFFSDKLEFVVSNGNNIKKLERLDIKSYIDFAKGWLKANPEFIEYAELGRVFNHSGFRAGRLWHNIVLSDSTDKDIAKYRKMHEKFIDLCKKYNGVFGCSIMRTLAHAEMKNNYSSDAADIMERIENDYKMAYEIMGSDETRLMIKMIDFCNENGFNIKNELKKINER